MLAKTSLGIGERYPRFSVFAQFAQLLSMFVHQRKARVPKSQLIRMLRADGLSFTVHVQVYPMMEGIIYMFDAEKTQSPVPYRYTYRLLLLRSRTGI